MAGAIGLIQSDSRNSELARRSALRRWRHVGALLACIAMLMSAGCGGGDSGKKSQAANEGSGEQDAAAEQPAAPPMRAKKPAQPQPQAAAEAPLPADVTKWKMPDLKLALTRKDFQFFLGVIMYVAKAPEDRKRVADLNELLQQIGRMKDDPQVNLPLPPGTFPATPGVGGTQPATAGGSGNGTPGMGAGLPGLGRGPGLGGMGMRRRKKD
jgi:hypothetical protein